MMALFSEPPADRGPHPRAAARPVNGRLGCAAAVARILTAHEAALVDAGLDGRRRRRRRRWRTGGHPARC
ncbi:MAG: hypothetical protein MZW92_62515 [Comamonadaceae bacterium]|nr:hypothetical protein [Comamonadaceae bacterium]